MGTDLVVTGVQENRTVLNSNVLVKKGSHLKVAYSSGNRFYVSSGGVLSGFHKGARASTIYVEKGGGVPQAKFLSQVRVVQVDNAERAYQQRYKELPPLRGVGGVSSYEDEHEEDDCFFDDDEDDFDRGIRPVSVSPDSYRSKD